MNKTVSINLGGFFFHIDEDAFRKLNNYLEAIRRSLSPDGKDEIMADIEGRIAELLSDKIKNDRQVIGTKEVEEIIAVMGQPEDYKIEDDSEPAANAKGSNYNYYATKKLYRDADKNIIAGVAAGLGHYFRIDPLWIRILFIISPFITFGTSAFIYVLLWVLVPKAVTTTEKLHMQGDAINISNIEKKVKEEFSVLQGKLQNVDYDKIGNNVKTGAEKIGNGFSKVILGILKVFAKILGAFIVVFSALSLGTAMVFFVLFLFTSTLVHQAWYPYVDGWNFTETPIWIIALVTFFATAIPFFALFNVGLRILSNSVKPLSGIVSYTLLAIWIISLSACMYLGFYQAAQLGTEGQSITRKDLTLPDGEVLQIVFKSNEYFTKYNHYDRDVEIKQDSAGNVIQYSNDVRLYIRRTDQSKPYIQIERLARASSIGEASKIAENIKYNFKISGNSLILDNYLVSDVASKFRGQRIEVFLYLPEGTNFQPDNNVHKYNYTEREFFNLPDDNAHHLYHMTPDKAECLDCVEEILPGEEMNPEDAINNEIDRMQREADSQDKTIRIMELEAERAKLEMERSKMEHQQKMELSKQKI